MPMYSVKQKKFKHIYHRLLSVLWDTQSSPCCWTYKVTLISKTQAEWGRHACYQVHSKVKYKLLLCHLPLCLLVFKQAAFIWLKEAVFPVWSSYPLPEKCLPLWVSVSPIQENPGTGRGKCNAEIRHQLSLWSYPDTKEISQEGRRKN